MYAHAYTRAMPRRAAPRYTEPCYAALRYAALHYAALRRGALRCAALLRRPLHRRLRPMNTYHVDVSWFPMSLCPQQSEANHTIIQT